ncbi:hypothetical protein [Devosia soli]|uniref:hypothetical protein n=1 Tax=Devosia soli TaxID=361041 RepID=UPI0006170DDF|nr:hypothetical protein [Devosia soli]
MAAAVFFAYGKPLPTLGLIVFAIIFQNLSLSIFAPALLERAGDFSLAQGANYIVMALVFMMLMVASMQILKKDNMLFVGGVLIVAVYAAYGGARSDFVSAASYFRLFTVPLISVCLGFYLRDRVNGEDLRRFLMVFTIIVLSLLLVEVLAPAIYHSFAGTVDFQALKRPGSFSIDDVESFIVGSQRSLFNLTGAFRLDIFVPNIYGPSVHPISTAYIVATLGLSMFYFRRYVLTAGCFVALILISAKGPLVLFAAPVATVYLVRLGLFRRTAPYLFGLSYAAVVIAYGLYSSDVHVYGLIAGLQSLLTTPWGHGLGLGGNLSGEVLAVKNAQAIASGAARPVESAIGVMAYQLGIVCLPLCYWVWKRYTKAVEPFRPIYRAFLTSAFVVMIVNAAFQEEAFSPAAFGLGALVLLLLTGLDRGRKQALVPTP